jgi:hypothetical protein
MRGQRIRWALLAVVAGACAAGLYLHLRGDASGEPVSGGSTRLVLYQTWVGGGLYTEGSRSYIRVSGRSGGGDAFGYFVKRESDPVFSKVLAPGRYTVESWQRPCDGNCGYLDPPTDRCRQTITLRADQRAAYVIRLSPGRGCRIVPRSEDEAG